MGYTTAWSVISGVLNTLVASGHADAFYPGTQQVYPDIQQRILVLDPDYEDDVFKTGQWEGRYKVSVRVAEPLGGVNLSIGSLSAPGLVTLVDIVKQNLALNFETQVGSYDFSRVEYGFFRYHPVRGATFYVTIKDYINPINRVGAGSPSIKVPELQAQSLDDLSDVTLTTEASGDVLWYNGSQWVNNPNFSGGGGGSSTLSGLNDVTLTSPASGQPLVYSGTKWINQDGFEFSNNGSVPLNIPVLVASPAVTADGDLWLLSSGSKVYWVCKVGGSMYSIQMTGGNV